MLDNLKARWFPVQDGTRADNSRMTDVELVKRSYREAGIPLGPVVTSGDLRDQIEPSE
jgi:hypothetical protein